MTRANTFEMLKHGTDNGKVEGGEVKKCRKTKGREKTLENLKYSLSLYFSTTNEYFLTF